MAENNIILSMLTGSRAYGTDHSKSDFDTVDIFVSPMSRRLDLFKPVDDVIIDGESTKYELGKFIRSATDCHPRIIELLFLPRKNLFFSTKHGRSILAHRKLFISKNVFNTFMNDINLRIDAELNNVYWHSRPAPDKNGYSSIPEYNSYRIDYEMYLENKRHNRSNRKDYNAKNAMHGIRFLMSGINILKYGEPIIVVSGKRLKFLKDVLDGKVPFDTIKQTFSELISEMTSENEKSQIPDSPNLEKINELFFKIVMDKSNNA